MTRKYHTLDYYHTTIYKIAYYLNTLGLVSQEDYSIEYESDVNEFRIWLKDEKYLTMIFLKFGGQS